MGKERTNYNKISEDKNVNNPQSVNEDETNTAPEAPVVNEDETNTAPEAPVVNEDETNTAPVIGIVTNCKALRVRKDPAVKSNNVISIIDAKTEVTILDDSNDDWYEIETKGGVTGFCMKEYITVK